MTDSTTTQSSSNPIAALFSHGFLAVLTGIIGLLASPLVLHLLPANIAAIVVAIAAAWKAYNDATHQQQTQAAVKTAAAAAVSAQQSVVDTAASLQANAAIVKAQASLRASPLQGGAAR